MKLGPENLSAEEKHTLSAKANSSMKGTIYILGQLALSFSYLVYWVFYLDGAKGKFAEPCWKPKGQ